MPMSGLEPEVTRSVGGSSFQLSYMGMILFLLSPCISTFLEIFQYDEALVYWRKIKDEDRIITCGKLEGNKKLIKYGKLIEINRTKEEG